MLFKRNGSKAIIEYSDADWGGDTFYCKSMSGYLFQIGGTAIAWQSKKQSCVALSTVEAEYVVLSGAAEEAVWLKQLNQDLTGISEPLVIYDNIELKYCQTSEMMADMLRKGLRSIKFEKLREIAGIVPLKN